MGVIAKEVVTGDGRSASTDYFSMPSSRAGTGCLWCSSWSGRPAGAAGHEYRNNQPSLIRREFEAAPGGGGGAVIATGAKFDAAVDNAEIEPMDETAIATLLTKVAHARPRPFAI